MLIVTVQVSRYRDSSFNVLAGQICLSNVVVKVRCTSVFKRVVGVFQCAQECFTKILKFTKLGISQCIEGYSGQKPALCASSG